MGENVGAKARLWFLGILPAYTAVLVSSTLLLISQGYVQPVFFIIGSALMIGCGMGAYRCATLIHGWKVRGLVLVKMLYNVIIVIRGALWFIAGFSVDETINLTAAVFVDVTITTFLFAVLSGLGFLIWYDLRPPDDLNTTEPSGSILAAQIDLRFWRGMFNRKGAE